MSPCGSSRVWGLGSLKSSEGQARSKSYPETFRTKEFYFLVEY